MTRLDHLGEGFRRLGQLFQQVYLQGAAFVPHSELCIWLHRERATKNFHGDIQTAWRTEMEMVGYDPAKLPGMRYAWVDGVNGWVFVWNGTGDEALDWKDA
jgi:hypothetical protein